MKIAIKWVIIDNVLIPASVLQAIMKTVIVYPDAEITISTGPTNLLKFKYLGNHPKDLLRVLTGAVKDSVFKHLVFVKGVPYITT